MTIVRKTISLPRDILAAVQKHRRELARDSGVEVSFSAALANALRLGLALRLPRRSAKRDAGDAGDVKGGAPA